MQPHFSWSSKHPQFQHLAQSPPDRTKVAATMGKGSVEFSGSWLTCQRSWLKTSTTLEQIGDSVTTHRMIQPLACHQRVGN